MAEEVEYLLVGTYTSGKNPGMPSYDFRPDYKPPAQINSKGIYSVSFSPLTGILLSVEVAATAANPSYLHLHPNNKFVYSTEEIEKDGKKGGAISTFAVQHTSSHPKLERLGNSTPASGNFTHINTDNKGKYLIAVSYGGSKIVTFPIPDNGVVVEQSDVIQCEGKGPHPERQEAAHPHCVNLEPSENDFAVINDLGTDSLRVYKFDGKLHFLHNVKVGHQTGPRMLAWCPPVAGSESNKLAYEINELDSTVYGFKYDLQGNFEQVSVTDVNPPNYDGKKWSAEVMVHPNGRFLYAANRIADSIAVCHVNHNTGSLDIVEHYPTHGLTPRNFVISPSGLFLIVANQHSDNVVSFKIDQENGKLSKISEIHVPSPVCVKFVGK